MTKKRAGARAEGRRRPKAAGAKNVRAAVPLKSLKSTEAFKTFVLQQLADLDEVAARAMFGGVGLYQRGVFFGIIARDVLYLKVDEITRPDYERAGCRPFKPYPDRAGTMRYYAVPVDVLESTLELTDWARKAVAAAKRASSR
jgi:DNA transformation protein and related proteins